MQELMAALEQVPVTMAERVRPALARVTREGYVRFLEAMYHYTRRSGERLRFAAERSPEGELKEFFSRLAREEAGHYRLAGADLAASGLAPGEEAPASVRRFDDFWRNGADPGVWLGALYALERVGGYLKEDAVQGIARLGLQRDQVRFVMVHLEADVEHGEASERLCRAWPDGERMLEAARYAGDFWVGLHLEALEG